MLKKGVRACMHGEVHEPPLKINCLGFKETNIDAVLMRKDAILPRHLRESLRSACAKHLPL